MNFVEIDTEDDLLCYSESIPSITNITIFYDGRDITGMQLNPFLGALMVQS